MPRSRTHPLDVLLPDLMRLAHILHGRGDAAQDLVQETMLRLLRRGEALNDIDDLPGYARTIMRNIHRRARGAGLREWLTDAVPEQSIPPSVFPLLALRELHCAIAELPKEQARLLRLVIEGETSPARLAARTGLPPGTVMSRLARARAQLRREMGLAPGDTVAKLY